MDLEPYIDTVREQFAAAAETAGPQVRELAERLAGTLDSALRLSLLEALSTAASEITRDLAPGSVDVRLRGREPSFVVTVPPPDTAVVDTDAWPAAAALRARAEGDEGGLTRINLRLNQELKDRVEEAARSVGLSVNAWLVRAAASSLESSGGARSGTPQRRSGQSFTGWVR